MKRLFVVTSPDLPNDDLISSVYSQKFFTPIPNPSDAEGFLVLGGDGTMLRAIRMYHEYNLPFVGINFGHLGFLMNPPDDMTINDIATGQLTSIRVRLLAAALEDRSGDRLENAFAFNDMYMERSGISTANIRVSVGNQTLFDPLVADGVIVSSAAGSTAYNAAARGPIVPLDIPLMSLTGVAPALYHNWQGSLLSINDAVSLEALSTQKRPVRFLADGVLIDGVHRATVYSSDKEVCLVFTKSNNFREKVLRFQFGQR